LINGTQLRELALNSRNYATRAGGAWASDSGNADADISWRYRPVGTKPMSFQIK